MKNFFAAAASFALLLILGIFVYYRLSPSMESPIADARNPHQVRMAAPLESPDNATLEPPLPADGKFAVVNRQRLEALKADKNYRGPSYMETREQMRLQLRLSGEKKPGTRVPAGSGQ